MPSLDPSIRDALEARLRFYRELGLTDFYRRDVDPSHTIIAGSESDTVSGRVEAFPLSQSRLNESQESRHAPEQNSQEGTAIPPRKPMQALPSVAPEVAPAGRASALQLIREEIGDCTRCALHKGRNKIVFADGDPNARLMFVGEGPGADEDAQGLPFVGRAGQLLNNMIAAMGLKREEVYIANVVK